MIPCKFSGYRRDGLRRMYFDLGGDAPPPPDYQPVADASRESAEIAAQLGRDQLAEARRQYEQNMAVAKPVVDAQLDIMRQTAEQGKDYYEYGKIFRPMEQAMLTQAAGGLTARDVARLGTSGVSMHDALNKAGNMARGFSGAAKMQNAWDGYWDQTKPGQVLDLAGGKITRNTDGSATFINKDGGSYSYAAGTPMSEVAKANPDIAADWNKDFSYPGQAQPQGAQQGAAAADPNALQQVVGNTGAPPQQAAIMGFAGAGAAPPHLRGQRFGSAGVTRYLA